MWMFMPSSGLDLWSLAQLEPTTTTTSVPSSSGAAAEQTKGQQQLEQPIKLDTDTIVIGNGPAGIALSTMLSGWQPFYNAQQPHPDPWLHERLTKLAAGGESLFAQDLASLADAYHSRRAEHANSSGQTPFAVLYDSLVRPSPSPVAQSQQHHQPSAAAASSSAHSCLCWKHNPATAVPHIVLGDHAIGGSWQVYDDEMVTVSVSDWMDLPGYSLATDFMRNPALGQARPTAALYKKYLCAYVYMMGVHNNMQFFTKVTHIEKFCHPITGEQYWEVRGIEMENLKLEERPFVLRCRNVVLACGQQHPKMLGVPGEDVVTTTAGRIVYSLGALKRRMEAAEGPDAVEDDALRAARADCPVIVVGDGISAADAVLHCLSNEQPVLHVIRRTERDLRNIQLARLSPAVYPEYARVFQLMTGRTRGVNYRRLLGTSVSAIVGSGGGDTTTANVALLQSAQGTQLREQFHTMAVCIGRRTELPLLKELLHNNTTCSPSSVEFSTHYRSIDDPTVFAIGAMAGDHFVRYLVGGALCVAQRLSLEYHNNRNNSQHGEAVQPSGGRTTQTAPRRATRTAAATSADWTKTALRSHSAACKLVAMLRLLGSQDAFGMQQQTMEIGGPNEAAATQAGGGRAGDSQQQQQLQLTAAAVV